MAEDRLTIDDKTVFDNVDERQVEFTAEVGGDAYQFAVQYGVLEALSGQVPVTEPVAAFREYQDRIETLGPRALARNMVGTMVVVSENDID